MGIRGLTTFVSLCKLSELKNKKFQSAQQLQSPQGNLIHPFSLLHNGIKWLSFIIGKLKIVMDG